MDFNFFCGSVCGLVIGCVISLLYITLKASKSDLSYDINILKGDVTAILMKSDKIIEKMKNS